MRKLASGLLALLLIISAGVPSASAGTDTVVYKAGVLETAAAKGETVLLHYKSTW